MENNSNTNHSRALVYLLVVFLAVFVGSGIFLIANNKNTTNGQAAASTIVVPTLESGKGSISLVNKSTLNSVTSPVDLSVVANSNGENITAFDTVVSYDQSAFDFVKAESLDQNFKVYPYKNSGNVTLTVVKTGSNKTPSIFKDNQVISLVFQPKKTGEFTFKVEPTIGKETTKFVNIKTEVIYPTLNEIKVTVN